MAPGPITSWQTDGDTKLTVTDFILGSSKITAGGDCSHEMKRCLLLGRKVMTNLDNILKSKKLLCQQDPSSQSYGFSNSHVWIWRLDYKESWAPKNWCFWTVVLEKILESPLDSKEIQPVHPKEISPEYLSEGLLLKLKLQYLGHLMRRTDSSEKTLMLGKIKGRRRGQQSTDAWMYHQLNGHDFKQTQEVVRDRKIWCAAVHGFTKSSTWLSGWTTTTVYINLILKYMSSIWSSPL